MRIALVNDVPIALEILRRVVTPIPGAAIAWTARDGEEAVARCREDTPDLILMDLIMPKMNGAEATARIMRQCPCAILVVTASVGVNAGLVYEAMGYGALDAVKTPSLGLAGDLDGARLLVEKINRIGLITGKQDLAATRLPFTVAPPSPTDSSPTKSGPALRLPPLLAVGASTGGPQALAHILGRLPADYPAALLLVQHVDEAFAQGLADWLGQRTPLTVRIAREGDVPKAGTVFLASTANHMTLNSVGQLHYCEEPKSKIYRPSVDVLFESLVHHAPRPGTAVLLTGMGRDGAAGMALLHAKGWTTYAQGPKTSVVYGMPRAAAERGAVTAIKELDDLAQTLGRAFR